MINTKNKTMNTVLYINLGFYSYDVIKNNVNQTVYCYMVVCGNFDEKTKLFTNGSLVRCKCIDKYPFQPNYGDKVVLEQKTFMNENKQQINYYTNIELLEVL